MEWVNVKTEMPDDDVEVLVYCEESELVYLAHHDAGEWLDDWGDSISKVTHWMEIIPPEEKS
jgi:hypothetical protein